MTKPLCGHFNRHWTVVTDIPNDTVMSIEYCTDCRRAVRKFPGRDAAEHMRRKARKAESTWSDG